MMMTRPQTALTNTPQAPFDLDAFLVLAERRLSQTMPDNAAWFSQTAEQLMASYLTETAPHLPGSPGATALSALHGKAAPHDPAIDVAVEILKCCCKFFHIARDQAQAIRIAQFALMLTERHNLLKQERHLCNIMGLLQRDAGQENRALMYFVQSISIAYHIGDAEGGITGWVNLASLMSHLGLFHDSIKYARRTLAIAAGLSSDTAVVARGNAHQIISRASTALGLHHDALVAIQATKNIYANPATTFDSIQRIRVLRTLVVSTLNMDRLDEAATAVQEMQAEAQCPRNQTAESILHAHAARAMLYATQGDFAAAEQVMAIANLTNDDLAQLQDDLTEAQAFILQKMGRVTEADTLRLTAAPCLRDERMADISTQLRGLEVRYRQRVIKT